LDFSGFSQVLAGRAPHFSSSTFHCQSALRLTRSAKKGEVLKESDFVLREIRVNRAGMYASKASQRRDDPYRLGRRCPGGRAKRGVTIQAKGKALESGALGDIIKVRNVASKAIVTATVVADDTVKVKVP
jgi:flagella basal body P-ring formation protein FlgA